MADLHHYPGGDLCISASGDLLAADGSTETDQRILRRLITNPGDYLWQPDYGGGLPAMVGELAAPATAQAVITGQMLMEEGVAADPPPEVSVRATSEGLAASIRYTTASGGVSSLSFSITG